MIMVELLTSSKKPVLDEPDDILGFLLEDIIKKGHDNRVDFLFQVFIFLLHCLFNLSRHYNFIVRIFDEFYNGLKIRVIV
jgi:hypothetical protein